MKIINIHNNKIHSYIRHHLPDHQTNDTDNRIGQDSHHGIVHNQGMLYPNNTFVSNNNQHLDLTFQYSKNQILNNEQHRTSNMNMMVDNFLQRDPVHILQMQQTEKP